MEKRKRTRRDRTAKHTGGIRDMSREKTGKNPAGIEPRSNTGGVRDMAARRQEQTEKTVTGHTPERARR